MPRYDEYQTLTNLEGIKYTTFLLLKRFFSILKQIAGNVSYFPDKCIYDSVVGLYYFNSFACKVLISHFSSLTLKAPNKNCSRQHFDFLHLSLEENKA